MMLTLFLPTMCTLSPKSMRGGPGFGGWLGGCGYLFARRLHSCGRRCWLCLWWQWSLFVGLGRFSMLSLCFMRLRIYSLRSF